MQSSPKPLEQIVFDRLNASLNFDSLNANLNVGNDDVEVDLAAKSLQTIGNLVRRWRAGKNRTRRMVAGKLEMDESQLLILENGLATEGDITASQIQALSQWLRDEGSEEELLAALQHYLDAHRKQ